MTTTPNPADLGELVSILERSAQHLSREQQSTGIERAILAAIQALAAQQREIEGLTAKRDEYKRLMLKVSEDCVEFEDRAEALEKERDDLKQIVEGLERPVTTYRQMKARADKAEAEVAAMRAKLDRANGALRWIVEQSLQIHEARTAAQHALASAQEVSHD